jgi:hypothetical protein
MEADSIDIFHDQEVNISVVLDVIDSDKVRMLHSSGSPCLTKKSLSRERTAGTIWGKHLHRDPSSHGHMLSKVHLSHPAHAEDKTLVPTTQKLIGLKRS